MRLVIDLQGAQGSSRTRGIGRHSRELAIAMARDPRRHEVIVTLSSVFPESAEELIAAFDGILPKSRIRLWHPPPGTAALAGSPLRGVAETLRAQFLASLKPDLVHVTSIFEGLGDDIISLQPRHLQRLPVVATCYDLIPLIRHDEYFGDGVTDTLGVRWYYRCVQEMALCDGLLAISESSREEAIRHLAFPPDRIFNTRAGVSPNFRPIHLSPGTRDDLLQRYGLRESFILFLGAGDLRKNEAGLIAAYARLPAALRARHQLVIVGKMDPGELRNTAAQLHVRQEDFAIIPFVREGDLNAVYAACALFVFPSLHEGFGLPVCEAMACGAPVITSNVTSLPEVIGRDDAMFDPTDPNDMAACMRKVLENPAFRDELAAYGPMQASRFTWQSSAALAWDALEKIHASRLQQDESRIGSVLKPRPKLAFVSPLPRQATGIADYSSELLPSLARHYDITLVSEAKAEDARLAGAFSYLDPTGFLRQAAQFERVLYQIGNSVFHRFQIEDLLPRIPGMVVLHDAFLSDYMNWLHNANNQPDGLRAVLLDMHGYPALRLHAERGQDEALRNYPCSLPVLENAIGVIQHSRHGITVLEEHFGAEATRDIAVIPHLRVSRTRPGRMMARAMLGVSDDVFVVCSFGIVARIKCPELLTEAWQLAGLAGRLVFVGEVFENLQQELANPNTGIAFAGRVTRDLYDAWLAAADVAVQWRSASRGETSGAIADALAAGLPLIVNRHGSAAELPEDVVLGLPEDADASALAAALVILHDDPDRRLRLAAAASAYARRELAPETIAQRYYDAIEHAYATQSAAVIAQSLQSDMRAVMDLPDGVRTAARAIAHTFPSPWRGGGRPRLLVDMSEPARHDDVSGIRPMVREIACRALEAPPPGWHGEAVRLHEGRLRHTYAVPLAMLGHAPLDMPATPVDIRIGDVLLCADVNTDLTAAEYDELRRLRLDGLRIVLLVADLLSLRDPELLSGDDAKPITEWYRRMLRIVDAVLCASSADADDLVAWLAAEPGRRETQLPIGYLDLSPQTSVTWDNRYRALCDAILEDRWHTTWRPGNQEAGRAQIHTIEGAQAAD